MSRKISPLQLRMVFPGESPEERQAANDKAIEEATRQQYPMTDEERTLLPEGVRLARFVPLAECRTCKLATEDHRMPGTQICVCLKDLHAQERRKRCQSRGNSPQA